MVITKLITFLDLLCPLLNWFDLGITDFTPYLSITWFSFNQYFNHLWHPQGPQRAWGQYWGPEGQAWPWVQQENKFLFWWQIQTALNAQNKSIKKFQKLFRLYLFVASISRIKSTISIYRHRTTNSHAILSWMCKQSYEIWA